MFLNLWYHGFIGKIEVSPHRQIQGLIRARGADMAEIESILRTIRAKLREDTMTHYIITWLDDASVIVTQARGIPANDLKDCLQRLPDMMTREDFPSSAVMVNVEIDDDHQGGGL